MLEVSAVIGKLSAFFELIDSGEIARTLADIEMKSAADAFEAYKRAKPQHKPDHLRSCCEHLRNAANSHEHFIRNRPLGNVSITRWMMESSANVRRRFALTVMAGCFFRLNDLPNARHELLRARMKVEPERTDIAEKAEVVVFGAYVLVNVVAAPLFLLDGGYAWFKKVGEGDEACKIDDSVLDELDSVLNPRLSLAPN